MQNAYQGAKSAVPPDLCQKTSLFGYNVTTVALAPLPSATFNNSPCGVAPKSPLSATDRYLLLRGFCVFIYKYSISLKIYFVNGFFKKTARFVQLMRQNGSTS